MTSQFSASEKSHIEKLEELRRTQVKLNEVEQSYASQIEQLYAKIAEQESKYKLKIEEVNMLQQEKSNMLISRAQSSQSQLMQSQI